MKIFNRYATLALIALGIFAFSSCEEEDNSETINFQSLMLEPNSYWNGSDGNGGLTFSIANFNNSYDATYDYWEGFAYSNKIDMETPGWTNQYSAYLLDGGNYQNVYSIAYIWGESATITFSQPTNIISAKITNSTWAYLSMLNGGGNTKKFEEGDWFKLTAKGYNASNEEVGTVDFYLADYRTEPHYIIDSWTKVDFSSLKNVSKMVFTLSSTDVGDWGMNTPAYFCMDDFVIEYEK